jgi:hypothetical protein
VIAVNGVSVTSRSVYADALSALHAGDTMVVTFTGKGKQIEEQTRVRLTELRGKTNPLTVLLFAGVPALCLSLGFWVVIVRPRDVRGWLLLALMLSLSAFFNSSTDFWSPPFRTPATIYSLLPLTLSYVVVVQRAMDVRLVIRQGLQYTLARRGVVIFRMLLSAALVFSGGARERPHRTRSRSNA